MAARIRQSEINSYMYSCLNICCHNMVVMRGVFSLLYVAPVITARLVSILRKYEDVYFLRLLCIYIFNLLGTKYLHFLMLAYLMAFVSMCNCLGLDVGCV
jgi:hypothetical protein